MYQPKNLSALFYYIVVYGFLLMLFPSGRRGYEEDGEVSHPSARNPWIKAQCQWKHSFILLK